MKQKNPRNADGQVRRKMMLGTAAGAALWGAHVASASGPLDLRRGTTYFTADPTWIQGAFHPGLNAGPFSPNNNSASVGLAANQSLRADSAALGAALSSNSSSALTLEVNLATGDVYAQVAAATALTGYDIFDNSNNLLDSGDPNTDMNERLLSQPTTSSRGNTTTFRNSTNYKLWSTILVSQNTLAEAQNYGKLKQGTASTYDTINIPANGTIDFGDVYNTVANVQDLLFSFSEADSNGNPVTGPTFKNAPVFYFGQGGTSTSSYWKDSVATGNWSSGNNWSATSSSGTDNAGAPASGNSVSIANADMLNRVITLDENSAVGSLQIGNTGGGTDTLSQTSAFNLTMQTEEVGAGTGGIGAHNQSAGTNTYTSALIIGADNNSIGTYSLSGTGSIGVAGTGTGTRGMYVGINGSGTFSQSGGTVTLNGSSFANLYVGYGTSGAGTYLLGGSSSLTVTGSESIGYGGAGTFDQTGGTNAINVSSTGPNQSGLLVGCGGSGTYLLTGGTLTVVGGNNVFQIDVIGDGGPGTFNQSGGLHTATSLAVGCASPGTYLLSNGSLNVEIEEVGATNAGTFNQSGGVNTCANLTVAAGDQNSPSNLAGNYVLSGGTLSAGEINIGSYQSGTFTQSGGTLVDGFETVGALGAGTFIQTGGVHTIGTIASPG